MLAAATAFAIAGLCLAAAGTEAAGLDSTFGSGGVVRSPEGAGRRVASYPGGRLVSVGAEEGEFVVTRHLSDGTPDPGFGTGGVVRVEWTAPFRNAQFDEAKASAVAVQPDGKILVGGSYEPNRTMYMGDAWRAVLARLNPDGTLDQDFRSENAPPGKVQLNRPFWREFRAVALQGSKIIVAGETGFVARLNGDGSLDRTFAKGHGSLNVPPSPKNKKRFVRLAGVTGLLVVHSGRIFAAGYANGRVMIARLHPNGTFDDGFGNHGIARVDASSKSGCNCSLGLGLARDRHGRLVVSGALLDSHPTTEDSAKDARGPVFLVRFRPNGRLDPTFGARGVVRNAQKGKRSLHGGDAVAIQADGRIVAVGQRFSKLAVARYRPNGTWDRTFFGNGLFSASFGSSSAKGLDLLVDASGRIVVSGQATYGADLGPPDLLLIRMRP